MPESSFLLEFARPVISFSVVTGLLLLMLKSGFARKILDRPNARSLHLAPVPRVGGLAVMAGIGCGWVALGYEHLALIYATTFALVAVSFADDLKHLPVWQRFLAHLAAAIVGVFFVAAGQPIPVLMVAVLAVVWMTNLFNFMDGADGLAGGMAVFGFGIFALQATVLGNAEFASLNAVIATAALGFLLFNFHPARVFMGDAGSIPLGFLAGLIGVAGWVKGLWPAWYPVLVFSPFIVDATLTLLKRLLRGEHVWQAHREHYYQRLILFGHGHRKIAWLEYGLMLVLGVTALWGARQPSLTQAILLGGWAIIYIALTSLIDSRWGGAGNKHK